MDSRAFYLKYRPQRISELDSTDVREGLERVLKSGKVPHAFAFVGPRGTGKTSAARILAKAINCQEKGERPCNKCDICRQITNGSSLDLIEIDAASNRGIDDIRDLRDKIKLAPVHNQYKVYIVDEVHMLTTEAFNALLKTLEEPPAHAVFILCTTAPEKLPKTILSRCLRFNFQKARPTEVIKALERAVKGEKLKAEKGVLEEIARNVDGSFRDAHKILEQLSFVGSHITLKETKEILGKSENLSPDKLLSLLVTKDIKGSLAEVGRVADTGGDLMNYVQEILNSLRIMMLKKVGLESSELAPEKAVPDFSLEDLKSLIHLFSRAAGEMKTHPITQLPLELAVVEWGEEGANVDSSRQNSGSSSDSLAKSKPSVKEAPGRSQIEDSQNLSAKSTGSEKEDKKDHTSSPNQSFGDDGNGEKKEISTISDQPPVNCDLKIIMERWNDLLTGVRPLNHSVEALLRAARPVKLDGEFLVLEVFYKFHKERLETEKCRSIVEEVVTQVLGLPLKLRCVLGHKGGFPKPVGVETKTGSTGNQSDIIKAAEEIFGSEAN
jgi:DNA polymerase-3 subunit gamma/tau